MNNIKTIADFKRAMTLGSYWEASHRYTGNNPTPAKSMGVRIVGKVQTNRFAFVSPETGNLSWRDWPKKIEFGTKDNGNIVVITTDFCELQYRQVN